MTAKPHIMIVEDDRDFATHLENYLERKGFFVTVITNGLEAIQRLQQMTVDLIVLDIQLPGLDGWKVLRQIRAAVPTMPVIMMTQVYTGTNDQIEGLNLGADDYLTKPFERSILEARIQAVIRGRDLGHLQLRYADCLMSGELRLLRSSQQLQVGEHMRELTSYEFQLLHFFMTHPQQVLSRDRILDNTSGWDVNVADRAVDQRIRRLRDKLEGDGETTEYIETIRGSGYRFTGNVTQCAG